jgi:hypothetical protein
LRESAALRKAIKVAAESTMGVSAANDNLIIRSVGGWQWPATAQALTIADLRHEAADAWQLRK